MALTPAEALADRLRALRREQRLTQAKLADALGGTKRISVSAISSWENSSDPKLPPADRLRSYALFFAQDHSGEEAPQLAREQDLTASERARFEALDQELTGLRDAARSVAPASAGGSILAFDSGPITIICPDIPDRNRSSLASEENPNFTRTHRYADLDALVEVFGQIRAANPDLQVDYKLSAEVEEYTGHVVVLGGIGWNQAADGVQRELADLPIRQVEIPELKNGEIFRSSGPGGRDFHPVWRESQADPKASTAAQRTAEQTEDAWRNGKQHELVQDIGFLARLRNPYSQPHTLTICSGVYSRGVLGAVLTLAHPAVRERNETYLANRFPSGLFVMLMRVPVVNGKATAPDLEVARNRLYEWSPDERAPD